MSGIKQKCLKCNVPFEPTSTLKYIVYQCHCENLQTLGGEQIINGGEITATQIKDRQKEFDAAIFSHVQAFVSPLIVKIADLIRKKHEQN